LISGQQQLDAVLRIERPSLLLDVVGASISGALASPNALGPVHLIRQPLKLVAMRAVPHGAFPPSLALESARNAGAADTSNWRPLLRLRQFLLQLAQDGLSGSRPASSGSAT